MSDRERTEAADPDGIAVRHRAVARKFMAKASLSSARVARKHTGRPANKAQRWATLFLKCALYCGAFLLALLAANALLRFGGTDLRVPFDYASSGDAIGVVALAKNTYENGWYLTNPHLGAPGYQDFSDYPVSAAAHLIAIRALSAVTGDPLTAVNLYFLLSFPIISVTTLYVLRRLGLWWPAAMAAALLYAFLPYHFLRSTHHLFLTVYYVVPLACLIALSLMTSPDLIYYERGNDGAVRLHRRHAAIAAIMLIAAASTDIYYAVFTGFFIAVAALTAWIQTRDRRRLLIGAAMCAMLVLTLAVQLAPSIFPSEGRNPAAVVRDPSGAEMLGLKITQLMLPVTGHRMPLLADLKRVYNSYSVSLNENDHVSLGLVGACGFLLLIGRILLWRRTPETLLDHVSRLNIAALLLGTMGGFGAISGLLLTPNIRGFNRIVVYVAFFSLLAIAYATDSLKRRYEHVRWSTPVLVTLICIVTIIGILDQFSPAWAFNYANNARKFGIDRDFVNRIEAQVPKGGMVFQLPFVSFPEHSPVHRMAYIEHLTAFLHSRNIHWSFGAMRGRWPDGWQRTVADMDPAQMAAALALRGFAGVYVDRFGYADGAQEIDAQLRRITGETPLVSGDDRKLFYPLEAYRKALLASVSRPDLERLEDAISNPVFVEWGKGAWPREGNQRNWWRWCDQSVDVSLRNRGSSSRDISLDMRIDSASVEPVQFTITSALFTDSFSVSGSGSYQKRITLPAGTLAIHIGSNAHRIFTPGDSRAIFFRVTAFQVTDRYHPQPKISWAGEFSSEESDRQGERWVWSGNTGILNIENTAPVSAVVMASLAVQTPSDAPSQIRVTGPGFNRTVSAGTVPSMFAQLLVLSPGHNQIRFESNGRRLSLPGDPRKVVFRVLNPHIEPMAVPLIELN